MLQEARAWLTSRLIRGGKGTLISAFACRRLRVRDRETQNEDSAALGAVVTGDLATMVLHYAIGGAQAKPGAFADRLGGIEGIKHALEFADTRPRIGEFQQHFTVVGLRANPKVPAAGFLQCVHGITDDFQAAL